MAGLKQDDVKTNSNKSSGETVKTSLMESPILNALRSHIEKWYPEAKHNRKEIDDILDCGGTPSKAMPNLEKQSAEQEVA